MTPISRRAAMALLAAITTAAPVPAALAQVHATGEASVPGGVTFADVASLADSAPMVVRARVRKLARVEPERTSSTRPGMARYYVQAETRALLAGTTPLGQSFAYLVDLPVNSRGKPVLRKKDEVILFARPVPNRPAELQLVHPTAQLPWSEASEARLRPLLQAIHALDAPARVTGVREIIHVPGTLAGEGETQIFLNTQDRSAASITVRHRPGAAPEWGVSFSELVAEVGRPPAPGTLEWYRLACFLPTTLSPEANMSDGIDARRMAEADYGMVMAALGPCRRTL